MAGRNEKHTVDFFPFYVKDGRTLFILESKYGCKGTGFFTNVLRFLCQTPDHHYCISNVRNADRLYFFTKLHCDEESGLDMLNIMAETGKINKSLWLKRNIIYSEDLINSLSEAYRNRKNKPLEISIVSSLYQLTTQEIELTAQEIESSCIYEEENTQRKEKKRKEKKNTTSADTQKIEFTDNQFINIPDSLKTKWVQMAPGISIVSELAKAEAWAISNPKLRKSNWSRFLTNWMTRAQDKARQGGNGNGKNASGRYPYADSGNNKPAYRGSGRQPAELSEDILADIAEANRLAAAKAAADKRGKDAG